MSASERGSSRLLDLEPEAADFRAEVLAGLSRDPKTLPTKYLYDAHGSHLFELICDLEEYYPTRTELRILRAHVEEMARRLGPDCLVIEPGAGSGLKTRVLLQHLDRPAGYVPVEISRAALEECASELQEEFEDVEILPVCADFTQRFALPHPRRDPARRVVFFPGSTIGNFEPAARGEFLRHVADQVGEGGGLLIGVDLRKDVDVLQAAYDDAEGVTARFNLNLLRRANRELGADFDLHAFRHEARWNDGHGRMEMHLVARRGQVVHLAGSEFLIAAGESLHTESSYKYGVEEFAAIAAEQGMRLEQSWLDENSLFSVQLFRVE